MVKRRNIKLSKRITVPHSAPPIPHRQIHIRLPHIFRMYPWTKSTTPTAHAVYSDSTPELVKGEVEICPEDGDSGLFEPLFESFSWVEDEPRPRAQDLQDVPPELSTIGHKILEDYDLNCMSSDPDTDSDCSDTTLIYSASPLSSPTPSSTNSSRSTSVIASEIEVVGLRPPWWRYSLHRKVSSNSMGDSVIPLESASGDGLQVGRHDVFLHESAGRWPDQEDTSKFMF